MLNVLFTMPVPPIEHIAPAAFVKPMKEEVKVVVVDDDEDAAVSLAELLEMDGYQVRTAFSAAEAITLVESFEPLCVLLDLGLPGMDGCELAKALRARHGTTLVLVAVTGWTREEDRSRAEMAGVDYILSKPVTAAGVRRLLPPID